MSTSRRARLVIHLAIYTLLLVAVSCGANETPKTGVNDLVIRDEYPFLVNIFMNTKHVCGGTILDNTHIVTLGRCIPESFDSSLGYLYIGDYDQRRQGDGEWDIALNETVEPIRHPEADLVIVTTRPMNFGDHIDEPMGAVKAIKFPSGIPTELGALATVAGWNSCRPLPTKIGMKVHGFAEGKLLADIYSPNPNQSCKGLLGSPLFRADKDNEMLGIATTEDCRGEVEFMDIKYYRDWILQNINKPEVTSN